MLLALVTFTRHFCHYLVGQKLILVTDQSAIHWLQSVKDPDGKTSRRLEKLESFDYEVRHRRGKSLSHADGLSRFLQNAIKAIESDFLSTSPLNDIPKIPTAINNYQEVINNVFHSKDSIAHCFQPTSKRQRGLPDILSEKFLRNTPPVLTILSLRYGPSGYLKHANNCIF